MTLTVRTRYAASRAKRRPSPCECRAHNSEVSRDPDSSTSGSRCSSLRGRPRQRRHRRRGELLYGVDTQNRLVTFNATRPPPSAGSRSPVSRPVSRSSASTCVPPTSRSLHCRPRAVSIGSMSRQARPRRSGPPRSRRRSPARRSGSTSTRPSTAFGHLGRASEPALASGHRSDCFRGRNADLCRRRCRRISDAADRRLGVHEQRRRRDDDDVVRHRRQPGLPHVQNPPNNGTLVSVGALGVDVGDNAGFDISAVDGVAYAALQVAPSVLVQPVSDRSHLRSRHTVGRIGGAPRFALSQPGTRLPTRPLRRSCRTFPPIGSARTRAFGTCSELHDHHSSCDTHRTNVPGTCRTTTLPPSTRNSSREPAAHVVPRLTSRSSRSRCEPAVRAGR